MNLKKIILIPFFYIFLYNNTLFCQSVWEQTNGPCSGQLTIITKDSQGFLYSITYSYTLYRSKDNGENWEKILTNVSAIAFDKDNNCYIGTGNGEILLYDKNIKFVKVLRNSGYGDGHVKNIYIDAKSNIYASIFWGILCVSTDKGKTWEYIPYIEGFDQISLDSNNVIIMTFDSGIILRSTNFGKNWSYIKINDAGFKNGFFYSAYNKKFDYFIAVGMGNVVYISSDEGLSWKPGRDSIPINYVEALFVDEKGTIYISGDSTVCYSTDGGYKWAILGGFSSYRIYSIVNKDNYIFFSTWSHGIIRYDIITKSVLQKNNGIINSSINQLSINQKGSVFAAAKSGIYRTTNIGNSWEQLVLLVGTDVECSAILCSKSGNIYASNQYGALKSTNNGQSWIVVFPIYPNDRNTNLILAESDNGRIYAGNTTLYMSDDSGRTWQSKDLKVREIVSIAIYQNKYLLVGSYMDGVYFSEDEGTSFRKLPLSVSENYGTHVAFNQNGDLFIGMNAWQGGDGVFRSTDGGKTFTILPNIDYGIRFLRINQNNHIYISSSNHGTISYSTDNGDKWESLDNGAIKSVFSSDICFGNNNDAYLGTLYDGVYKSDNLNSLINIHINPNDLVIFPNPTSDNITISFENGASSIVESNSLSIYNSLGIKIKRFGEKELFGQSSIKISIEDFPSGIYYVTYDSGMSIIAKSFVVLR
ncbi:MAG: hypothetical protein HW421_1136 [Ignavibacteria bacterium]|nr:hypothetical protein [Ignavibacteria bacterium]